MGRLENTSIVVTGAASGIGRGFAEAFAREGAQVGVVDLNLEAAQGVVDEITAAGGKALAHSADVSQRDQVTQVLQKFVDWAGKLDVIFNNAGYNKPMPLMEVTEENFNAIMSVNALGVLICTQEAAKHMIPRKSGKIINTASVAGFTTGKVAPPVAATQSPLMKLSSWYSSSVVMMSLLNDVELEQFNRAGKLNFCNGTCFGGDQLAIDGVF
mgnify:CR=1 FL=1